MILSADQRLALAGYLLSRFHAVTRTKDHALMVAVALAFDVATLFGVGVPEVSGCVAGTQRCDGQLPEVCSSSGRWWPSLPVRPDGSQRACVACVVEDGVAGCAL